MECSLQFLRTGDRDGRYLTALGGWIMSEGENVFDKYVKRELNFQFKHTLPRVLVNV